MGDIKKLKKRYSSPRHPWKREAIEEERQLKEDFGLKKKKEIYIAISFLKKYKDMAKRLIADRSVQGEKEKAQMLAKLQRIGLLTAEAGLDGVLSLQLKDVLSRRLQSLVCRNGLARSMKQARQFIGHRHILVGEKEMTSPSTVLTLAEESQLRFKPKSTLSHEDHPERALPARKVKKEVKKVTKQQKRRDKHVRPKKTK